MGLLSHYLYDRGCRITGVDMDPKIVIGAKMAANILGKDISFEHLDVDNGPITENYDTICLFSVIHHVKNFSRVTENIAQKCSRIILECGLKEHGSKPVGGEWTKTSGWEFASLEQLTDYLEKVFTGFKFRNYYGSVDRNRHIIALVKQPICADGRGRDVQLPAAGNRQTQEKPEYLVSAIVSTYNSEKFIRGCLEDLENQTIADKLEIIVVNSGSEQNEELVVKEFQKRYSNIVYVKTDEREGLYSAWNRAVKIASGQFLTSTNTDDRHRKDAFEVMANTLLTNTDIALVYGDQIVTDTPNPTFENHHAVEIAKRPAFSRERLLFGCCVGSQPMWRKTLHDELGGFDETLTCAGDWDFWLKVAAKYSFKHIPESLGLYYRNEQGIEHGRKIHSLYERYAVGRRYGNPYISVIQPCQARGNPLVSVWMAVYNGADYIAQAIESVLIQNYRNFELIVVDDGSTDRTADIVHSFKHEAIKYFLKDHGGLACARNVQLQKSGGSFIVSLDSDDMMTPDFLSRHLEVFERRPEADLVYCDDYLIDEKDKPIRVIDRPEYSDSKNLISDLFRCGFPIVPFRTCIRKSVFDKIGLYDERLIVAEDYDMMRRFVNQGLRIQHLPGAFYLRRVNTSSHSRNLNAAKAKSQFEAIRRFTETFTPEQLFPDVCWENLPAEQKPLLAKCKAALVYIGIGEQYLASNARDFVEAAFEMAYAQLDDCCKIEPANHQVRNLREKCQFIRAKNLSSGRLGVCQPA
jgi:glycosyltransferase involved in cell wall biosynthesis